jgi:two-component system osmolarity sensor histidine kinase EnvZ
MKLTPPQSYFWKILTTITLVSVGFQLFTLVTLAYYMVVPLGQRAAGDLASVITHAAETWVLLPAQKRPAFEQRMISKHELLIANADTPLAESSSWLPYLHFLQASLSHELNQPIHLWQSVNAQGENWFWVDIPQAGQLIRFGFPRSRLGVNPPIAFFLILFIGLLLTLFTAATLTRRLTIPIERLHHAAQDVGKGHWPDPIKEDGPLELMVLTREFNRMNIQVRELLSNRTTLLAGIAHDLRTPLTQIQLALTLLPEKGGDEELMASIQEDLSLINRLIDETLSIGLELEKEKDRPSDIASELKKLLENTPTDGIAVHISNEQTQQCQVMHPLALRRIIGNLLGNALRYGNGKPVEIRYRSDTKKAIVEIIDSGDGIPEQHLKAVFQPFFRLETSRSSQTGGSGLGLAIVLQLANANKWKIELLPRSGGGTRAVLSIPCNARHETGLCKK